MPNESSTLPPNKIWFDYDTAPEYLGISQRALKRLMEQHRIEYTRLGRKTLWSQSQLDNFVESCAVSPSK
ncbi:excisionase family DNA-binding protein [Lacisediminihabitans sp. H27-G8]|uniref:excisionase family DNA-binding protein n=1 Tax=Lacisediminihabitans sp. H27-G8 TaxID=3111909 RepID=UPI0038FCBDEB